MSSRKVAILLRYCEFLADHVICRDSRRNFEAWVDSSLLPRHQLGPDMEQLKHWLPTRIDVTATFVRVRKYRLRNGEWILRTWHTALPSRLQVTLREGVAADVERAKAIHTLLGEDADVIEKIRAEVGAEQVEHVQIQDWFDRLGASSHLKPRHVTWDPDYDPYYFEQLRRRRITWFLQARVPVRLGER